MSTPATVGEELILSFLAFDSDGITPKTGLVDGDFTKRLYLDDAPSGIVPVIQEIGTSGTYSYKFTPDTAGRWFAQALWDSKGDWFGEWILALEEGIAGQIAETQMNVSYDGTDSTLYMEVWLDRHGRSIPSGDLISCEVQGYDHLGTLLFAETSSSPKADGRFSLSTVLELEVNRPYNLSMVVTDNQGPVSTFQAFTAAG